MQSGQIQKPQGDGHEFAITVTSKFDRKSSANRNSECEKSNSLLIWSFANNNSSILASNCSSHSNLNVPDSSGGLREGGTEYDQGMPIDTIVDCEELINNNKHFLEYEKKKAESRSKHRHSSLSDFLKLPFARAVRA